MKKLLFTFAALLFTLVGNAQIGYQVSLLNTATGEPRANETVSCVVELKNSEGRVICSETKSATSNDLGVISLSVGNAKTFDNMDWSKLPLYVSVTVDGKLIGQSQVLTVPVAEYAKKTGTLTYENVHEKKVVSYFVTWGSPTYTQWRKWTFTGRTAKVDVQGDIMSGTLHIDGNAVFGVVGRSGDSGGSYQYPFFGHYSPEDDTIYVGLMD